MGLIGFKIQIFKIMNNNFKSKIWITLVLSILLAFSSCGLPYCKKVPFSKNDLEWLSPYTIGDTIIFVNDKTYENDTVIVTDKSIYNPSNTNIFDLRGCNWLEGDNEFKAIAVYEFKIIHNQKKFHCMTILEKESNDLPAMISFGFFGKYTNKGYSTKEGLGKTPLFPNYEGNIVVTDSNLHAGKSQLVLPLSELYWNKEKGLLGYQIEDTIYTLKE